MASTTYPRIGTLALAAMSLVAAPSCSSESNPDDVESAHSAYVDKEIIEKRLREAYQRAAVAHHKFLAVDKNGKTQPVKKIQEVFGPNTPASKIDRFYEILSAGIYTGLSHSQENKTAYAAWEPELKFFYAGRIKSFKGRTMYLDRHKDSGKEIKNALVKQQLTNLEAQGLYSPPKNTIYINYDLLKNTDKKTVAKLDAVMIQEVAHAVDQYVSPGGHGSEGKLAALIIHEGKELSVDQVKNLQKRVDSASVRLWFGEKDANGKPVLVDFDKVELGFGHWLAGGALVIGGLAVVAVCVTQPEFCVAAAEGEEEVMTAACEVAATSEAGSAESVAVADATAVTQGADDVSVMQTAHSIDPNGQLAATIPHATVTGSSPIELLPVASPVH